ncbi:carbohydrate esterase [Flammeovirgaceae bacterium 311]|nr:carbohydrate esterase [Flammeovirgaceae bacterium 311]
MTVKSPNLKGRGDICVFVPPGIRVDQTLPVVLLLHGVYGSAWSWALKAGVHLQASEMIERKEIPPMIIAMPSDGLWGDGSAYLPHNGYNFEQWIVTDVVDAMVENIPGATRESPLFIAGLSMGGFGALRIGAKYGSRFSGISGLSSITGLEQMKLFVEEDLEHYAQENQVDEDVFNTFQQYRHQLPPIRFDCGTDDLLIEYNRKLHRQLQEAGIAHIYEEYHGGHEWNYWKKYVAVSLNFFNKQLQTKNTAVD